MNEISGILGRLVPKKEDRDKSPMKEIPISGVIGKLPEELQRDYVKRQAGASKLKSVDSVLDELRLIGSTATPGKFVDAISNPNKNRNFNNFSK